MKISVRRGIVPAVVVIATTLGVAALTFADPSPPTNKRVVLTQIGHPGGDRGNRRDDYLATAIELSRVRVS